MEKNKRFKTIIVVVSVLMLLVVAFFAGRYLLYTKIKDTIASELRNLKEQEIDVTYDDMEVYPWDGKIEFNQLNIKIRKDKNGRYGLNATLPYALIKGIDLIPFIRSKTLAVHTILVQESLILYAAGSTLFENEKMPKLKIELKHILVGNVDFPKVDFYLRDTLEADTLAHIITNIHMDNLALDKQLDSLIWRDGDVRVTDFAMRLAKESYGFSVKKISLGIGKRTMKLDTIVVKPVLDREEFNQKFGIQTTYLDAFIPEVELSKINWFTYPEPTIEIGKMTTSFNMKMYRDKRLPNPLHDTRPLPTHLLHRLKFKLRVDSIDVNDSFLSYEEFPENNDSTGIIYFDKLTARINGVHNNAKHKKDITMKTFARFMGEGELNASFTFPYDSSNLYRVKGSLEKFPLSSVNRMLGSAAKAKIENGFMNRFDFEFAYNDRKSTGSVKMQYEGLKLVTLRENKDKEQAVSPIKTWILNTFFIKKDPTKELSDDTRKGEIEFYRDTQKSVFNYWWKSILSGIKSAYNLDKIPMLNDADATSKGPKKKKKFKEFWSDVF